MDTLFPVKDKPLSGAVISPCGQYRYTLDRLWRTGLPTALFIMLNPSTADASVDDQTIRRCRYFATREGCGGLTVVNLYALRSTDPAALLTHPDPVGPENAAYVGAALDRNPALVIAAWGSHRFAVAQAHDTTLAVERILGRRGLRLKCLGTTKDGSPRHPSRLPNNAPLITYTRRKVAA